MMISYQTILLVIALHWVADFVLQTDWQAKNKSTNVLALCAHVATYTACLLAFAMCYLPRPFMTTGLAWAVSNGLLHLGIDCFTSRINSQLWKAGKVHYFFVAVGFDQMLHYACLFGTLAGIGP